MSNQCGFFHLGFRKEVFIPKVLYFRKSIAQNIHDSIYFVKEWQRQVKLTKLNSGHVSNQYCLFHLGFRKQVFIKVLKNRKSIAQNIHNSIYFVKEWQRQGELIKLNSGHVSNQCCLFHLGFRKQVFIPKVLNFRKSIAQNIHDSIYFVKNWQRQGELIKLNSGHCSEISVYHTRTIITCS